MNIKHQFTLTRASLFLSHKPIRTIHSPYRITALLYIRTPPYHYSPVLQLSIDEITCCISALGIQSHPPYPGLFPPLAHVSFRSMSMSCLCLLPAYLSPRVMCRFGLCLPRLPMVSGPTLLECVSFALLNVGCRVSCVVCRASCTVHRVSCVVCRVSCVVVTQWYPFQIEIALLRCQQAMLSV